MLLRLGIILACAVILNCCKTDSPASEAIVVSGGEPLKIKLVAAGKVNYLQCSLNDSVTSAWPLRYPVYRFSSGDVNNDGQSDIAVGVIKTTRRDTVARKRLFLFQVRNRAIIPLWLGSSLGRPLEDFALVKHDSLTLVRSIELEKSQRYLVAEYEWFGFGLSFRRYLHRELSLKRAQALLAE